LLASSNRKSLSVKKMNNRLRQSFRKKYEAWSGTFVQKVHNFYRYSFSSKAVFQAFPNNSKYLSRFILAVVIFVLMCVTGTSFGLVFIINGLGEPGLVILIWSPFWRLTLKPSISNIFYQFFVMDGNNLPFLHSLFL
jgi:hypothetical protein